MTNQTPKHFTDFSIRKPFEWAGGGALILSLLIVSMLAYAKYTSLENEKTELAKKNSELQNTIVTVTNENNDLKNTLAQKQNENANLSNIASEASGQVNIYQKLANTDKELLQKYSKIYFLNENYIPDSLVDINEEYLFDKNKPIQIQANAWQFLRRILIDSKRQGLDLKIISGYRSFGTQSTLKSGYKTNFGTTAANSFSADQGYSEHQLGTTVDFTTTKVGASFTNFEKTPEYAWLIDNAYKYGFEMSYPKNNKYYVYEPWHWRFVGTALASYLNENSINFYDMDQRDIDKYLLNIFD